MKHAEYLSFYTPAPKIILVYASHSPLNSQKMFIRLHHTIVGSKKTSCRVKKFQLYALMSMKKDLYSM